MAFNPHAMAFTEPLNIEGARRRTPLETIGSILPFLWPAEHRGMQFRVVVALTCLLLGRSANVYGPIVLKDLIDTLETLSRASTEAIQAQTMHSLILLSLLYGSMVLLPGILTEIRAAIFTPVSEYAQRVFGLKAFRHLHELGMRFHLDRQTGGLSRAIERGTRALQQITGLFAFNIAPTLFEITIVCIYLASAYHPKYVLVILFAVGAYILFTLVFTEWRTRFRREMVLQETRANTIGVDSLLNFETVKYFNNERYEAERYNDALFRYMRAAVRSQNTLGFLNGGQLLIRVLCQIAILYLAIADYSQGNLSTGEVVMLNTFMLQLFIPLGFLGSSYRMIRQALVDMESMFQILDLVPEIRDAPGAGPLKIRNAEITFEAVSFSYDQDRSILDNISFRVAGGKTTAIVGPSGAGKSTIARLLYRFYDVQAGRILIDGQDISKVTQESLRQSVGIVPQDTVLFNDTIRYNIRYGRPDASDEETEEAARLASIHEFIQTLPQGYDTRVGERGLKLSGGEKQRVAIARTILKDPAVLILDEATSALDIKTEREIQSALQVVSRNRTSLVIAHRLSTIVQADEILVMDAGRIIERGTHTELVEANGMYAGMWRRQKEATRELRKIQEILEPEDLLSLQLEKGPPADKY